MATNCVASLVFLLFSSLVLVTANDSTLKSIYVVFRHGDRAPLQYPYEMYPNDPYSNYTFDPIGHGGLTRDGKLREYNIGHFLRKRYNDLLGDTYTHTNVVARSTNIDRTKMSLQLVLAALYPPKGDQQWSDDIKWQPIPINYVPTELDVYFFFHACPTYQVELAKFKSSKIYQQEQSKFYGLMKDLSNFTGHEIANTERINSLFHSLTAEEALNLTLPEWTKPYFPDGLMLNAALAEYDMQSYTPIMKRLNGGATVRKVLNDMSVTMKGQSSEKPKIHLYSCHETNIAGVLHTLNLWKRIVPAYSSSVIFELHEIDSKYFIKILYYKGIPSEHEDQTMPGCTKYCPVDQFIEITKDVVPTDVLEACFGAPEDSMLVPRNANSMTWLYAKLKKWFPF